MAFISKEIPTGSIDGVNKSFTLQESVEKLDDVFVDGAIYFGASASGQSLTLADAPTSQIYVDYWSTTPKQSTGNISIEEFKVLWEEYEDADLPSDAIVYLYLNEIDQTIYEKIRKVYPEKFISEETLQILTGTNTYALPSDFDNINNVRCGVYGVDDNGEVVKEYQETEFGSLDTGFYFDGQNIVFTTKEPNDNYTTKLRYLPVRALYDADTDELILPERYNKFYCDWFSYLYNIRNEDYDVATVRRNFAAEAENIVMREYSPSKKPVIFKNTFYV